MRAVKAFAPEPWLPLLVLGWICGVLALSLRLMSGWVLVQRMKSHGTLPASESWQATALRLSRRLHIGRPVRLLQSSLVGVPTVIGWIKPVVLLPASALAGLSPEQLEAILAHELAHIRRHDYLVNLLQTLVETLLFYHPAVWWVSRRIRIERENCCDDLAVSLCGDPYAYARALADLEELRGSGGQLVMAANGGSLVQRIRRLLGAPAHPGRSPGWLAGGATILLMLGIAGGAAGTNAFQSSPATPAAPASIARPGAPLSPYMPPGLPPAKAAVAPQAPEASGAEKAPTAMEMAGRRSVSAMAAASTAMSAVGGAGQTHHMFSSSNNGETLKVTYDGEIEFTDDDMDVRRLSPGGLLKIADGGFFAPHTIEFAADASGKLTRRFWLGMSERPFEPEGRLWTAKMLPRFIRQTGIGAPARVARIFKSKGSAGVLAEIALIEGSWGKRVYFTELLNSATLDSATLRQVLTQAGREIDSDYELASLLIGSADKLLVDEGARQAYFEAARSIGSDFEARRVYSSALKRGPVSAPILAGILDASRQIDSDFEQATLLIQIAKLQPLDNTTRGPFFSALATVQSDFEHRRVLGALAERSDLTPETTSAMLTSGATVQSDFEAATFLLQIAKQQSIEGALRVPFFRAVDSIGSPFERGRVLQAVAARSDASADTVMAALRAASTMGGGFEPSRVLLAIAQSHVLAGPAREAYIDAAQKLGDFEQGQVLAALVRSERANRR
jgi:Zn-dependent protease with chaperone function